MLKFSELSVKKYIDGIKYEYVNVIVDGFETNTFKRIDEIIRVGKTISYMYNGMIYVYDDNFKDEIYYGIMAQRLNKVFAL